MYVGRSTLLHDTIHQFKLLPEDFVIEASTNDSKQNKNSIKELRHSTKVFNIVSERLGSPQKAIKYDITSYNSLFDGCCMTLSTVKSDMIVEIEAYLREEHYLEDVQTSTLVVDFMSFVRSHTVNQSLYANFRILAEMLFNIINMQAPGQMIHVVFDSYVEKSLK